MAKHEFRTRYVDMWGLPSLHPTNVELLQQLKTADTQHFTKNMDVVGTVSELNSESTWDQTHLVGVRSDVWKPDQEELEKCLASLQKSRRTELKQSIKRSGRLNKKQSAILDKNIDQDAVMQLETCDIVRRRLVLKLFKTTGTRTRWCGTIEEVTTTEVHNSMGSSRSLLTMAVMLPGTEMVTSVQENRRAIRIPSVFTFSYFDGGRIWNILLKQRWVSLGIDFDMQTEGKRIGMLDGTFATVGSDFYVNLSEHPLAEKTQFLDLLTLFASSVGYHKAMRRGVKRRIQADLAGESHRHVIEDEELRLRHNGRAAA